MPRLGWLPDYPDHRDLRFAVPHALSLHEGKHSNRDGQSPVRDQGDLGSCVGMSAAAAVDYLRRTDLDDWSTIYSPLAIYYEARKLQGWELDDNGAMIRDAVKVLMRTGASPESAWPYYLDRFAEAPTPTALAKGTRWQLGEYRRADSLDAILGAISQGLPVLGGFSVYESMFSPEVDNTGVVPMPGGRSDRLLGGHAILFTGFDFATELLEFKNSWGSAWGNRGYGFLPFAYASDPDLADDFWVLISESEASFRGEKPSG